MAKALDVESLIEKQTTGSEFNFTTHAKECNGRSSNKGAKRRRLFENLLVALLAVLIIGGTVGATSVLMWYFFNNKPSVHHGRIHVMTRSSPQGDYIVEWQREQISRRINASIMYMDPQGALHKAYTNDAGTLQFQRVAPSSVDEDSDLDSDSDGR